MQAMDTYKLTWKKYIEIEIECGWWLKSKISHSNHVTSSKRADTFICHTTMRSNPINFLYNLDHVTLWCVEVGPVANAKEGSMHEHDRARVVKYALISKLGSSISVYHFILMIQYMNIHVCKFIHQYIFAMHNMYCNIFTIFN